VLITGTVPVVGSSVHSNDPAVSIKDGEFIDERPSALEAVFCLATYTSSPIRRKKYNPKPERHHFCPSLV
jgi:hypothetical protein